MRKYFPSIVCLAVVVISSGLQSCHVLNKTVEKENATMENHPKKIVFVSPLESIDILFSETEVLTIIPNDFSYITDILKKAKYDKKWNDTGMMVKMRSPDYSLNVKAAESTPRMVFLWMDGNRVKVDETWYFLDDTDAQKLGAFLSKYKI